MAGRTEDRGAVELVSELSSDLHELVRQELELARAEIREEARRSLGGVALLAGAATCAGLAVAAVHGGISRALSRRLSPVVGGALLGTGYGIGAAVLGSAGLAELRQRAPFPRQTIETLKEDIEWAAHPTTSVTT